MRKTAIILIPLFKKKRIDFFQSGPGVQKEFKKNISTLKLLKRQRIKKNKFCKKRNSIR
jgi:hypothetical protein